MKNLISILILLVAFGCGKSKSLTEEDVVGTYEMKGDIGDPDTSKFVFLESGKLESYRFARKKLHEKKEGTWKIVEKEVHAVEKGKSFTDVIKMEPNGDLTVIAGIEDGKRTDLSKDGQVTFKKAKE